MAFCAIMLESALDLSYCQQARQRSVSLPLANCRRSAAPCSVCTRRYQCISSPARPQQQSGSRTRPPRPCARGATWQAGPHRGAAEGVHTDPGAGQQVQVMLMCPQMLAAHNRSNRIVRRNQARQSYALLVLTSLCSGDGNTKTCYLHKRHAGEITQMAGCTADGAAS